MGPGNVDQLVGALNAQLTARLRGEEKKCPQCVLGIDTLRDKNSLLGYVFEGTQSAFFKIACLEMGRVCASQPFGWDGYSTSPCPRWCPRSSVYSRTVL